MKLASLEAIVRALNDAGVRFLVAGGVAVNAHGYLRYTADLDLVVGLEPANVMPAFSALATLGYQPAVPVSAAQFADETIRQGWIDEKGMSVLNFFSDAHRETSVDMFVEPPFDFDVEYSAALVAELSPGLEVRFVSLATLIAMKEAVGRPKDRIDVEYLQKIQESIRDE